MGANHRVVSPTPWRAGNLRRRVTGRLLYDEISLLAVMQSGARPCTVVRRLDRLMGGGPVPDRFATPRGRCEKGTGDQGTEPVKRI